MKKVINLMIAALAISVSATYAQSGLTEVTSISDFQAKISQSSKTFVKFYATWCGSCKHMKPIIDAIAGEYGDTYDFIAVDVDAGSKLADKYDITGLPTVIFFKDGKQVGKVVGEKSREDLTSIMKQSLGN